MEKLKQKRRCKPFEFIKFQYRFNQGSFSKFCKLTKIKRRNTYCKVKRSKMREYQKLYQSNITSNFKLIRLKLVYNFLRKRKLAKLDFNILLKKDKSYTFRAFIMES